MSLATCIGLFDTGAESVDKFAGCSASEPPLACVPDSFNSNACQAPHNRDKFAGVASEPPLACLPESFNSNTCQSPDNRDTSEDTDDSFNSNAVPNNSNACSTVIQDSFNSRLLHSCSHSAFLKAIFFECARLFCSGNTDISVGLDLTVFAELSEELCRKHQAEICDIINRHDIKSLQHSIFDEQHSLLIDCVRKVIWCKIITFLNGNLSSFVAICENRPDLALRKHVTRVTVEMAKYFYFPHGLYLNPFVSSELLSQIEESLVPLCIGILDHFTPPARTWAKLPSRINP